MSVSINNNVRTFFINIYNWNKKRTCVQRSSCGQLRATAWHQVAPNHSRTSAPSGWLRRQYESQWRSCRRSWMNWDQYHSCPETDTITTRPTTIHRLRIWLLDLLNPISNLAYRYTETCNEWLAVCSVAYIGQAYIIHWWEKPLVAYSCYHLSECST